MSNRGTIDVPLRADVTIETGADKGPLILGILAFLIFAQGLMYLLRPEMTGRAMTTPIKKIRKIGAVLLFFSSIGLFLAYSWWRY